MPGRRGNLSGVGEILRKCPDMQVLCTLDTMSPGRRPVSFLPASQRLRRLPRVAFFVPATLQESGATDFNQRQCIFENHCHGSHSARQGQIERFAQISPAGVLRPHRQCPDIGQFQRTEPRLDEFALPAIGFQQDKVLVRTGYGQRQDRENRRRCRYRRSMQSLSPALEWLKGSGYPENVRRLSGLALLPRSDCGLNYS